MEEMNMPIMKQHIMQQLRKIEEEESVKIIYACESGSRAWGFPSKDSDYDVRFIYVRPVEWYLSIFDKRDVIEQPISNMLDINGWDLKKALYLLKKSNPPLLEWLQSPILYLETTSIAEQIREMCYFIYSSRTSMQHYLHMAKGNYRDYLQGEQVKIKKYFYVLRPILGCQWIEHHHTMPPMEFDRLVDECIPKNSELSAAIENLLVRKKAGDEMDYEPRIEVLNEFLEERIAYYEALAPRMLTAKSEHKEQLDALFRSALQEVWM
ncbi:hypothetical protein UB51_01155 [Paenibacillus sp. IHBB 10380]|nr:hypothetical protein UB51_01155 [Paenibacillus sp. IHBB 10380]